MILKALTDYYETLLDRDEISRPGWEEARVSYGLELGDNGEIFNVLPLMDTSGKKPIPRMMTIPMQVKRSRGAEPNFLCDNSNYIFGIDKKKNLKHSAECFAACKKLHHQILGDLNHPAARAILQYFDTWNPEIEHPILSEFWTDLIGGGRIVFWYDGQPIHDIPEIRQKWQEYYDSKSDSPKIRCLVTGKMEPLERIHPNIKGVMGAQPAGATLVTYNEESFRSYGMGEKDGIPVGKYVATAYTTALNQLLLDRNHIQRIGEKITMVCWAFNGETAYQDCGMESLYGGPYGEKEILETFKSLSEGKKVEWNQTLLDPDMKFYILGLAPNGGRLSVCFFWQNSFGNFARNVLEHNQRIEIVKPYGDYRPRLSPWWLMQETLNQYAKRKPSENEDSPKKDPKIFQSNYPWYVEMVEKDPKKAKASAQLTEALVQAILNNTKYPEILHNRAVQRIRAEREITWGRAAILKAYLLKNCSYCQNYAQLLEVAQVELNEKCEYLPYVLGRLFAVLEKAQKFSSSTELNRTIKDSYFNSAATTPGTAFSKLLPLNTHHMRKLRGSKDKVGLAVMLENRKASLMNMLHSPIPTQFTPEETDCFYIGYYHEANQKKEEN